MDNTIEVRRAGVVAGMIALGAALLVAAALIAIPERPPLAMGSALLRDLAAIALFVAGTLAVIWRRRLSGGAPRFIKHLAYCSAAAVIAWRVALPLVGGLLWWSGNR